MKVEGAAKERKICLGWMLDTRSLLVSLPDHKTSEWISQIDSILKNNTVTFLQRVNKGVRRIYLHSGNQT